jgi:hypothetical protein
VSARSKESRGSVGKGKTFRFALTSIVFVELSFALMLNAFFLLTVLFWAGETGFGAL